MGHIIVQGAIGTASLGAFGGLNAEMNPESLPESASPRNWDVDFLVGSVFTRPGLSSVYTFTATLLISAVEILSGGIGVFSYTGKQPLINEGLLLSNFSGNASFLNGLTVTVISATATNFTAEFVPNSGTYTNLNGIATSTTGNFVGPFLGNTTAVIPSSGSPWVNQNAVLSDIDGYASTTTGAETGQQESPTVASNESSPNPAWTNPGNVGATGALVASVSLLAGTVSSLLLSGNYGFALPGGVTVTGISTSFSASTTGLPGTSAVQIQLANSGGSIGSSVLVPINSAMTSYTQGSPTFQWGTTLSGATVNGDVFGVTLQALQSLGSAGTFSVNSLTVTVYYTTTSASQALNVTQFTFAIPVLSGISGFGVTFNAYTNDATIVSIQLLKNGVPTGNAETQALDGVSTVYTLGSPLDLFGTTWDAEDVNNVNFGVQITASGAGTTFINEVDVLTYITPGLNNFNYVKTYAQDNGQIDTLALDASGIIWLENVNLNPGVLSVVLTGILPGSYARSATSDDREYICFSDLTVGTDRPRTFDGTNFYPLSQVGPGAPPTAVGTITNANLYNIVSITQDSFSPNPIPFNGQELLWSAGPGLITAGSTLTFYYGGVVPENPSLLAALQSGIPVYVYINPTGLPPGAPGAGTWLIQPNAHGAAKPPSETGVVPYFNISYTASGTARYGGPGGTGPDGPGNDSNFQLTLATLTVATPIPNVSIGDTINIAGASPSTWDGPHVIVGTPNSGVYAVSSVTVTAGTATYTYQVQSGAAPLAGELTTITGMSPGLLSVVSTKISTSDGTSPGGTFTISGITGVPDTGGPVAQSGAVGSTFGTVFLFDPGAAVQGTDTDPILGDAGPSGTVATGVGTVGPGTRQIAVYFITESGLDTALSYPSVFTVPAGVNTLVVSNIPIGPPNVVARGLAITEAGQNGVPGANFYVIPDPVTITIGNASPITYSSTIIRDNNATTVTLNFSDAVLLDSEEVDIQGNDLFNLIELGSSAWCVPYAGRMFYGLQLNKVDEFNNLSFDGGYLPNQGGNLFPLGWTPETGGNNVTLIPSPVTGDALYFFNTSGITVPNAGVMSQTAYLNYFGTPIININTTYSIRVTASCPSGIQQGLFFIDLVDYSPATGFGQAYGGFSIPLSSMTTNMQVFTGTLLVQPFPRYPAIGVSPFLTLAMQVVNLGPGADCLIDRIEIFPTEEPNILAQVYGSYIDDLEAIDASGSGGIVDTSEENPQAAMGGFVLNDVFYILKTDSMVSTQDNPSSEPGGWGVREVSNKVGSIGISSYDTGEEWAIMACRSGVFAFNGGQPSKISQEIFLLWNQINWFAGNTIWVRNDIVNKRLYVAVPLPTGVSPTGVPTKTVQYLPFAPYNPTPTSPNVIFMCNWQGMNTVEELIAGPGVHTTMFGTLAAPDMKRKWTVWQIASPYADFISQPDVEDKLLYICNGINSEKIYQLLSTQYSDDGVAINSLYTTYGHVNAEKAATLPIFGFHAKRYTVLQGYTVGQGNMQVRVLQNTLSPKYPWTIPGGVNLSPVEQDDWFRPINIRAQRAYLEFSTNAVGSWFSLTKTLLSGKADAYNLNPTGGGNAGT